jgi:hypothetical protein
MKLFSNIRYLIIIIVGLLVITLSCSKTNKKKVTYIATDAISEYNLQYINKDNILTKIIVSPQSAQDEWNYNFIADYGEIVYISGDYRDINSSLKIMILVDGKVYKQASNEADTLGYLTVSGTVPYD